MRHLLIHEDFETESSRDDVVWNCWTLHRPHAPKGPLTCQVAMGVLRAGDPSQLHVVIFVPVKLQLPDMETLVASSLTSDPALSLPLRGLWSRGLLARMAETVGEHGRARNRRRASGVQLVRSCPVCSWRAPGEETPS